MLFILIIGIALLVLGVLNFVFATKPAPAALEPLLGGSGRRLRAFVSFFPAEKQEMASRVMAGLGMVLGGGYAVFAAIQRLFLS